MPFAASWGCVDITQLAYRSILKGSSNGPRTGDIRPFFLLFEHSSFMVKRVVTAFFFCLSIRRFRGYGPVTTSSNCLTVRCFRARATSSKLDCRRSSVQFVKIEDFDEHMSDGPEQMPEQPDSPGGARCARLWLQWRDPPWRKAGARGGAQRTVTDDCNCLTFRRFSGCSYASQARSCLSIRRFCRRSAVTQQK